MRILSVHRKLSVLERCPSERLVRVTERCSDGEVSVLQRCPYGEGSVLERCPYGEVRLYRP